MNWAAGIAALLAGAAAIVVVVRLPSGPRLLRIATLAIGCLCLVLAGLNFGFALR
jgi:hypothetical protein